MVSSILYRIDEIWLFIYSGLHIVYSSVCLVPCLHKPSVNVGVGIWWRNNQLNAIGLAASLSGNRLVGKDPI